MRRLLIASLLLVSCATAPQQPRSEHFVFHNDPTINLHHFLYEWARNVPQRPAGDRRRAIEVVERAEITRLSDDERRIWEEALRFYRERMIDRDLTFDAEHTAFKRELLDGGTSPVLEQAMPVYRRHWWERHRARNAAWIEDALAGLRKYERPAAARLATAYDAAWPREPVRVDVSAYANWPGAYTTNAPDHVTISPAEFQGLDAVEVLFHEISHAAFFETKLYADLTAAFGAAKPSTELLDQLVHAIQFATPAEILRIELARPNLTTVGESTAMRGRLARAYATVIEEWRPFLEGRIAREEALARIARKASP